MWRALLQSYNIIQVFHEERSHSQGFAGCQPLIQAVTIPLQPEGAEG